MSVSLAKGVESMDVTRLPGGGNIVGQTIRQVMANTVVSQYLGLTSRDAAEVYNENTGDYEVQDSDYEIRDGDEINFTQTGGEKGTL